MSTATTPRDAREERRWLRRRALHHPGTWFGFLGLCFMVLWALTAPNLVTNFALHAPFAHIRAVVSAPVGQAVGVIGVFMVVFAFLMLRPSARGPVSYRTVLALWCLPLLLSPPLESFDVYAYLDGGWQYLTGYAPYSVGLSGAGGPFMHTVDLVWRGTPVNYPPVSLAIQALAVVLGRSHVTTSLWAMRLISIGGVFVIAWGVPKLARVARMDPTRALYIALLNPITVIDQIGGVHNDGLMAAVVVCACVVAARKGWLPWLLASLIVGIATLIKQPGLWAAVVVTMLAFPTARWGKRIAAMVGSVVIAVAVFIGWTLASGLGFGWLAGLNLPSAKETTGPFNTIVTQISIALHRPLLWDQVRNFTYIPVLLAFAWLILRRWRAPFVVAVGGWFAYAFLGTGLRPWYLLPALPFLGLLRPRPSVVALIRVCCCYLIFGAALLEIAHVGVTHLASTMALAFSLLAVWGWDLWQDHRHLTREQRLAGLSGPVE